MLTSFLRSSGMGRLLTANGSPLASGGQDIIDERAEKVGFELK